MLRVVLLHSAAATKMEAGLLANRDTFFDGFTTEFFSVDGVLKVTEAQRQEALELCAQAAKPAAMECLASFGMTDFREDRCLPQRRRAFVVSTPVKLERRRTSDLPPTVVP